MADAAKVVDVEAIPLEPDGVEPKPPKKTKQDPFIYHQKNSPLAKLTEEERKAYCSKGGKTTQRRLAHRKSMQQLARDILDTELPDTNNLKQAMYVDGLEDFSGASAIMFVQFRRACNGDLESAKFLRDTSGQKPVDGINVGTADNPVGEYDLTKLSDAALKRLVARTESEVEKYGE